ncbi:MAG: DegT/DnrJ/EryC1/StrS family aminotransferase, partial [Chitinivibrionales bacterium]|nr:DegT/DnrJ/EryC1/StrS family aminotransferase [Chitinivibrionales bacterium]
SLGKAGAFSFYPGKNLGALGEGGAVTTADESLAQTVRMLRDHGQSRKYYHEFEGYNGRLDALQAGLLSVKLKFLPTWNNRRRQHAAYYNNLLETVAAVIPPFEPGWAKTIYHLYVVRVKQRDTLQDYLKQRLIGTGLHYPVPLHLQKAYGDLHYAAGDFPVSEKVAGEILSLPMFPELTEEQQNRVVAAIADFVGNK